MSAFKSIFNTYTRVAEQLAQDRRETAVIIALDVFALVADRVQNDGIGSDGVKFPLYSQIPGPYWLLNPSNFNSSTKITKFKKDARKGRNNGSYHALRKAYGLPVDKRTLTFDGDMWKSVVAVVVTHTDVLTIVELRAKDEINQKKINYNSRQLGISIISFSKSDKEIISEMNVERVQRLRDKAS